MEQPKTVGEWLKEKCNQERLSLREAGKRTGLSHSTIQAVMKGSRPSLETVGKLAKVFGWNGENERAVLEGELFSLAGWPTKPELGITQAQLIDAVKDFSEAQLKVVLAFATYLAGVTRDAQ